MKKQPYSLQFPRKKDIIEKNITERANFLLSGIKDNLPKLREYIKTQSYGRIN